MCLNVCVCGCVGVCLSVIFAPVGVFGCVCVSMSGCVYACGFESRFSCSLSFTRWIEILYECSR